MTKTIIIDKLSHKQRNNTTFLEHEKADIKIARGGGGGGGTRVDLALWPAVYSQQHLSRWLAKKA